MLVSMVGMTVSVRHSAGIPSEKSILGSESAATNKVASQFTTAEANWLDARRETTPSSRSVPSRKSPWNAIHSRAAVSRLVSSPIEPT